MRLFLACLLLVHSVCGNAHQLDEWVQKVKVHSYDVRLEPFFDFDGFKYDKGLRNTFNGQVSIVFSLFKIKNQITLSSSVKVETSKLTEGRKTLKIIKTTYDGGEYLELETEQLKPSVNYTLTLKYSHTITEHACSVGGVFSYEYDTEEVGKKNTLLGTLLAPHFARKAFPCFDSPKLKAPFRLSVIHPKAAKAYGNEEIQEQKYFDEQRVLTTFKPTVPLAPHQLIFAIGDFVESNATSRSGVVNHAIALKNFAGFTDDAAVTSAQCMNAIEDLIKTNYPLKKLDHLDTNSMCGSSFGSTGLIIHNQVLPNNLGQTISMQLERKHKICNTVANEWFGGFVTTKKWEAAKLEAALSSFFQDKALEKVEEFNFISESQRVSNFRTAVSIHTTRADDSEYGKFDPIVPRVGAGLLNGVRNVLGDEVFYQGLTTYQQENAFGTAGLKKLMKAWIKARKSEVLCGSLNFTDHTQNLLLLPGVPTVYISRNQDKSFQITQKRDKYRRSVPIFILDIKSNKEHVLWLSKDNEICSPDGFKLEKDGEYIFNNEAKAFANVEVSNELRLVVLEHQNFTQFSIYNQLYSFETLKGLKTDKELLEMIYNIAKKTNGQLHPLLLRYPDYDEEFFTKTLTIISDNFDYKLTPRSRMMAERFLENAVKKEIPSAVQKTTKLFEEFKKDCAPARPLVDCPRIPPEWRRGVYQQGYKTIDGRRFLNDYAARLKSHKWFDRMSNEYYYTRF